ncbi:MAG: HD domain-containing phosphohydrolase [Nitriliruptoraceae bacterium]
MFSQQLDRLQPGAVLARTVYDEGGRPLLVAGVEMSDRYIRALRERGVHAVFVRDGLADDVVREEYISEQVRASITSHVSATFSEIARLGRDRRTGSGGVGQATARLGEQPLDLGADGPKLVATLYDDVDTLMNEVLESDTIAGLESLKSHNEYTFQHSVDVAVIGLVLGRRLLVPHERLRQLALGCLLHDLGKTYIDTAILDKPGSLTDAEFDVIREHPRMGYELIRRMPITSLLPAHVAYQHHERQSGGGYPRGLVGDNSVGARLRDEQVGIRQMLLIAEIAAVADVLSALSSDRPYRAGLPADEVLDIIAGMSGDHLNREVVDGLVETMPRYPVGHWVEVTSGPNTGARGVVTDLHRRAVNQPTIRLLLDARGEQIASPFEVDTSSADDIALACLPRDQVPTEWARPGADGGLSNLSAG